MIHNAITVRCKTHTQQIHSTVNIEVVGKSSVNIFKVHKIEKGFMNKSSSLKQVLLRRKKNDSTQYEKTPQVTRNDCFGLKIVPLLNSFTISVLSTKEHCQQVQSSSQNVVVSQ